MTERLSQNPFEEQVQHDLRFQYLLQVSPNYTGTIVELLQTINADSENLHANFWLDYLQCTNTYVKGMDGYYTALSKEQHAFVNENRQKLAVETTDVIKRSKNTDIFQNEELKGVAKGMGRIKGNFSLLNDELPFYFGVQDRVLEMVNAGV